MITGFNTDIEYEGVTYHIQTEDKGIAAPLILTLVYERGTILASKRSPYDDLLIGEFDEKILIERLKRQHKLMCGAVRAGRLEDLKRMTMKESEVRKKGLTAQKEIKSAETKTVAAPEAKHEEVPLPTLLGTAEASEKEEITFGDAVWDVPLEVVEEPAGEFFKMFEEETILPSEAVEIISDLSKLEPTDNRIKIEFFGDVTFKGGERKTISLLVWRGSRENGLSGAQVLVKVIGATFRPLIFHSKTDSAFAAAVFQSRTRRRPDQGHKRRRRSRTAPRHSPIIIQDSGFKIK